MYTSEIGFNCIFVNRSSGFYFFKRKIMRPLNQRRLLFKGFYLLKATIFMYEVVNCVYREVSRTK